MSFSHAYFLLLFLAATANAQTPAPARHEAASQPGSPGVTAPAQAHPPTTEEFNVSYDGSLTKKRLAEIAAEKKAHPPGRSKAAGRKRATPASPHRQPAPSKP